MFHIFKREYMYIEGRQMNHTCGETTYLEGAYFDFLYGWLSSNNGGTRDMLT